MSVRSIPLFGAKRATPFLRAQWVQKGALQPLLAGAVLLEDDRSATLQFRGLWSKAFPDRRALPFQPLADEDGRGTQEFWDVFG